MVQGFLPGHEHLEVIDDGECYQVNYGFFGFACFAKDDRAALRVTVVQLANMKVRTTDLSRRFGVSRHSIYRWLNLYKEGALEALVALKAGAGVKVTDDIKDYIVALHAERHRLGETARSSGAHCARSGGGGPLAGEPNARTGHLSALFPPGRSVGGSLGRPEHRSGHTHGLRKDAVL